MCAEHADCERLIKESRSQPILGCPMRVLSQKLKNLKAKLKSWNKGTFGDVHIRVDKAMKELNQIQELMDNAGFFDNLFEQEKSAQIELEQALNCQEEFWREKSRLNWHYFGDRNTEFFHKTTKYRHVAKKMSMLMKGDIILDNAVAIENHALKFYTDLFALENTCVANNLVESVIHSLVTMEDNAMLTNLPSMDEVKNAVFSMNGASAPAPDGFGGFFFQKYWDIIATDV